MNETVVLVACAKQKLEYPAPAQDLYTSPWFKKARAYAEAVGDRWFILSAKYGLVNPDRVIAPYDATLNDMSATARNIWATRVYVQIVGALPDPAAVELTVMAGKRYREYLLPKLIEAGYVVEVPMEGLGIGKQMAWLMNNTPAVAPAAA